MKILGLISSPADPASRFRIIQYKPLLAEKGIQLTPRYYSPLRDNDPAAWMNSCQRLTGINAWRIANCFKQLGRWPVLLQQYRYELIWQNRLLLPFHNFFEKKYKTPLCFDMDDAIWINEGESQLNTVLEKSVRVFTGNEYLADYAAKKNKNTFIVPTPVNTELFIPAVSAEKSPFTLGWIGSAGNLRYIEKIREVLLSFLQKNKSARLIIVSSAKPAGFPFDQERIIFRKWEASNEHLVIQEFSAGLMPLEDNAYTRGKCSFKMLQYMACGIPVLVSPVGMNRTLLKKSEIGFGAETDAAWTTALETLLHQPGFCKTAGANGRKLVEQEYSLKKYAEVVADIFINS